jgi:hypothetical protein
MASLTCRRYAALLALLVACAPSVPLEEPTPRPSAAGAETTPRAAAPSPDARNAERCARCRREHEFCRRNDVQRPLVQVGRQPARYNREACGREFVVCAQGPGFDPQRDPPAPCGRTPGE